MIAQFLAHNYSNFVSTVAMFPAAAAITKGKGFSQCNENYEKTENLFELVKSDLVISSPEHE